MHRAAKIGWVGVMGILLGVLGRGVSGEAAIVTVNVLTDNAGDNFPATCSLRSALATASADDEIQFSVTLRR